MKKTSASLKQNRAVRLRKKAERRLKQEPPRGAFSAAEAKDVKRLIAELQTHQIELELQNEELRKAQVALAMEREKYANLYNFAPIAYFTLDENDVILELNLAAANLLGGEREKLQRRPLTPFLSPDSLQALFASRAQALASGAPQTCELKIRPRGGPAPAYVQAQIAAMKNPADSRQILWRAVMMDVTERKRAEEEIRKLSRAVEQSQISVIIADAAGNIEYVNPKFCEVTGYSAKEAKGKNPRFLKAEGKSPEEYAELWRAITSGEEWRGEFHNKKKNGEPFWESTVISPIKNEQGTITHFVAVKEDITERKRMEEKLRESEARYKSLFENNHAVMLLIDPATRQIVDANPAACSYYGYSRAEFTALKITEVNTLSAEQVSEEMRRAQSQERNHFFFRHRLASGEIRDVEVYSGPIEIGGKKLLYSIVHDVVEKKQAERELAETNAQLRATLDALPDLLFEVDRAGRIHKYHAAQPNNLRLPPEEFLGRKVDEILPPEAAHTIRGALERAAQEGYASGAVYALPIQNQNLWFELSIAPKKTPPGESERFILLARNVTDRKRYQDALKQVNKNLIAHVREIEALQEQLREQAIRDPLTGLFNRRYLQETLEREVARARRARQPIGVIIMDVDFFKRVNDTYGHKAGDLVLEKMGALLKSNLRAGDIPCRYGGEEFTIIMPGASLEAAVQKAEKLLKKIAALRVIYEKNEIRVTVSVGVAAFPQHGKTGEQTLICADKALYRAKESGRNRLVVYEEKTASEFLDADRAAGVN